MVFGKVLPDMTCAQMLIALNAAKIQKLTWGAIRILLCLHCLASLFIKVIFPQYFLSFIGVTGNS